MKQSFAQSSSHVRRIAIIAATFAIAAMIPTGCSPKSSKGPGAGKGVPPVPVLVATAVEKDVPVQLHAIGNVMPYSKVTIRSQITGQLREVHFKDGQAVKKGDLLFSIDPRPQQAALEQAQANLARDEAQLENARIAFNRSKRLFDSQLVSQEDFDNARAAMDALQGTVLADRAAITNATLSLAYTSIRAPVDGVAGAQLVFAGNIVKSPDDQMLTINQIRPIYVSFAVPEQYLPEIRREMREKALKVSVTFAGLKGETPQGELTFVDNTVDVTTGMIQLKATVANEDSVLWPGQFVQVEIVLAELPRAVVVPSQAIQSGQNGEYVFVVKPDQTVEMRTVKTGESVQGESVVSSGLQAGETVVMDGQLNLTPGRTVNVKSSQAEDRTTNAAPEQP